MPIVAVAGIIGGASALAAGGLGVLGTIAAIGSIVSGIGTLTGNKTLMKIGAVASLAGGIGAFAQSQGWMPSTGSMETAAGAAQTSGIDAMQATPSGAEFSMGTPPNPYVGSGQESVSGMYGSGADVVPAASMGDAMGAAGASEAMAGGSAPTISDSLGQTSTLEGGISSAIGQQSPEISNLMGSQPSPAPGLMDSVSPLGDNLGATNPLAGGAQEPVSSLVADAAIPSTNAAAPDMNAVTGGAQEPVSNLAMPGGTTPPNPFMQGEQGKSGVLDLFNKFFRNKDGSMNKDMMSLAGNFVGGMFDQRKRAESELLKARAETKRKQLEYGNSVPNLGLQAKPKPGGLFRTPSPTYQPVRLAPGGLFNAR